MVVYQLSKEFFYTVSLYGRALSSEAKLRSVYLFVRPSICLFHAQDNIKLYLFADDAKIYWQSIIHRIHHKFVLFVCYLK